MQNLLLQANLIYQHSPHDSYHLNKALKLINHSITIEPYFYNLYLKSQLLRKLNHIAEADSCASQALRICPAGYQTLVYEPLINELKSRNPNYQNNQATMPRIKFKEEQIDCGKIPYNTHHEITLPFTNTGKSPLLITFVSSTCGCINPQWNNKPVLPGERGEIKVDYHATGRGTFNRTIFVQSNATTSVTKLILRGVVK